MINDHLVLDAEQTRAGLALFSHTHRTLRDAKQADADTKQMRAEAILKVRTSLNCARRALATGAAALGEDVVESENPETIALAAVAFHFVAGALAGNTAEGSA